MNPAFHDQFRIESLLNTSSMEPTGVVTRKETVRGHLGSTGIPYAASGMQGHRPSMEDAHVCQPLSLPHHALFAVLDGHGGEEAAQFCSEELVSALEETPDLEAYAQRIRPFLKSGVKPPNSKQQKELDGMLEHALERVFVELDRDLYLNHHYGEEPGASAAGSTCVAVVATPFSLVCANVGDSRCVLATSGIASPTSVVPLALSDDHKPELEGEEERIVAAGGYVVMNRVDGELAVSRAFGDFELKDVGGLLVDDYDYEEDDYQQLLERAIHQKVSAHPEIRIHPRSEATDRFLVLACDGVFDVAANEDVVEWVASWLQQGQSDVGVVCENVLDKCLKLGSQDNMTIIIVLLEAGQKLIGKKASKRK